MPTLLDDRLVADALTALTGWSGDAKKITRTVALDGTDAEALLAEVAVTAEALNHHPDVERSGGAVVFELSTHSEGGVTEYDIALASRIDDLISKVTGEGGGTVVGAPTDAGSSSGSRHVGTGHQADGSTRTDAHVPSAAAETAERGDDLAGGGSESGKPQVGAASAGQTASPVTHQAKLPTDEDGAGDAL